MSRKELPEGWAVPKGSLVLVTGANGFVGSHVADQFLCYGFKVRVTVRNVAKNAWLQEAFDKKYGKEHFTLWEVPDMASQGAFDQVIQGVSVVVHTASVMTFDPDPNKVIPQAIELALNVIKAAYAELSVRRFVFCSSSSAVFMVDTNKPGIVITEETWNVDALGKAWADLPHTPEHGNTVYSASKVLSEQAIWKYYNENLDKRPDIVVNTGQSCS
ncbi:hypothetical protein Hte_002043 [Hypoxylon texense]